MRNIRWCESRPKEVEGSAEYLALLHEQLKRFPPKIRENKVDNVDAHRVTAVQERARPSESSEGGFARRQHRPVGGRASHAVYTILPLPV